MENSFNGAFAPPRIILLPFHSARLRVRDSTPRFAGLTPMRRVASHSTITKPTKTETKCQLPVTNPPIASVPFSEYPRSLGEEEDGGGNQRTYEMFLTVTGAP